MNSDQDKNLNFKKSTEQNPLIKLNKKMKQQQQLQQQDQQEDKDSKNNNNSEKFPSLDKSPEQIYLGTKRQQFVRKLARINKEFRESHNIGKEALYRELAPNAKMEQILEVSPSEIIFKDVAAGQIYQMRVTVKNKTKVVRRIRIFQPRSPEFRCDYEMGTAVAPGLSIELIISFESSKEGEFRDEISLISDQYKFDVRLLAYSPRPKIIFEPFINMGCIQIGKTKQETILFKNEAKTRGRVELSSGEFRGLKLEPSTFFLLEPGESKQVLVSYEATESGIFRGVVEVFTDGKSFLSAIDINATCVDFMQFIIDDNGKEISMVEFGRIVFGQMKRLKGHLVNNSPERLYFNVSYLKGHFQSYEEENNVRSPHEVGIEQTRRILSIEPSQGWIDSYSQVPITFVCRTSVEEDHIIWAKNYCLSKGEGVNNSLDQSFLYTSVVFFSRDPESEKEDDLTKTLLMKAEGTCPRVYISEKSLSFGNCSLGSVLRRKITLVNDSNSNLFVECPNLSHFHSQPKKLRLRAETEKEITIAFSPRNLGKIKIQSFFIVNQSFPLSFLLDGFGTPKAIIKKGAGTQGISSLADKTMAQSMIIKPKYKLKSSQNKADLIKSQQNLQLATTSKSRYKPLPKLRASYQSQRPDYLKESRVSRLRSKKLRKLNFQMSQIEDKVKESMPKFFNQNSAALSQASKKSNLNGQKLRPIDNSQLVNNDIKFLFNTNMDGLDSPRLNNPEPDRYLFVTKPVGKYEPQERNLNRLFDPDPNLQVKPLPSKPAQHRMMREINQKLDGHMLMRIHAGPKVIDFGDLFVNSSCDKYFFIRNDLKDAISARMILTENDIIKNSYDKPQVLMSGQTAGFKIRLRSSELGSISESVSYVLNERHFFKFIIKARVIKVRLKLSTQKVDISFNDESLEMEAYRRIYLTNEGNANAAFSWFSPSQSFRFEPFNGIVKPDSRMAVKVFYRPNGVKLFEEETMDLQIVDGDNEAIIVTGQALETSCDFDPKELNFGALAVSEPNEIALTILNNHPRSSAVFYIDESTIPGYLKLNKLRGKIFSQNAEKLIVKFSSSVPQMYQGDLLTINIRGGQPVQIPIAAEVIIPKIMVYEKDYDFGKITYGNSSRLEMNLENTSPIIARLRLDLRPKELHREVAVECLKIEQIRESEEESLIIEEVDAEKLKKIDKEIKRERYGTVGSDDEESNVEALEPEEEVDDDESNFSRTNRSSEDSLILDQSEPDVNFFIITLKPHKIYKFELTFTPQTTKLYKFRLPLYLGNKAQDNSHELQKWIVCHSVPPKLILDPIDGVRDFSKKIISQMEGSDEDKLHITITNPDLNRSLNFFINSSELDEERVFSLSKSEGTIGPNTSLKIHANFKPHIPGKWTYRLPLYLDDDKESKKAEIILKGEAAFPKLMFDRRQIIMPVVPLGVESRCFFRIINEGFKNVTLKASVCDDYSILPLRIEFSNGHTMGLSKKVIKAEVYFTADKAISFTTRIDIEDDQDGVWSIYCSGTADNCLLTNHYYFMRQTEDSGDIMRELDGPVMYKLHGINPSQSESGGVGSIAMSKFSSLSEAGNLGYSPIPFSELEKHAETLSYWLKQSIAGLGVTKIPDELITENGASLLLITNFLTKKSFGAPIEFDVDEKQSDKIRKTFEFYSNFIKALKEQGAYLSHIRPEFLLEHHDLLHYFRMNPVENAHAVSLKLNEEQYKYLSLYSWTVLINQIIKIFYLARVNYQKLKAFKNLSDEMKVITRQQLNDSNIYSPSEVVLLKWVQASTEKIKRENRDMITFSRSLQSGLSLACLLHLYTDHSVRPLRLMKEVAITPEDITLNMSSVKEAMQEISLGMPIHSSCLEKLNQIQGLLLLSSWFLVLPFYTPKESVEFECLLNETIVKKVILSNPTGRKVDYEAKLSGSSDYELDRTQVSLEGMSRVEIPIRFYARITRPVSARLSFIGASQGINQAAPVVFDLVSKVVGRKSTAREEVNDVRLYDVATRYLTIQNPFDQDVEFEIKLEHLPAIPNKRIKRSPRAPAILSRGGSGNGFVLPSFFISRSRVHIKAKKRVKLKFQYIPLTFEIHLSHVILADYNVGELQYDLIGTPLLPKPIQSFPITTEMDNTNPHRLMMSMKYKAKYNAYEAVEKLMKKENDGDLRNFVYEFLGREPETEVFRVEVPKSEKEILTPKIFRMVDLDLLNQSDDNDGLSGRKKSQRIDSSNSNIFSVALNFRFPVKDHSAPFLLKNSDLTDVRIYELIVTIIPRTFQAIIEFSTNAKIPIKQDIPISNGTPSDLNFEIDKEDGNNGELFTCQSNILVPKQTTVPLTVTYSPKWIGKAQTVITVSNPSTKETFEYTLKGKAEEPLSEDHIAFKCDVGKETSKVLKIANKDKEKSKTYGVEFDMHGIEGPRQISIKPGREFLYKISVKPSLGGIYAGAITFRDTETGEYLWYSMELESRGQKNMTDYEVSSLIRKPSVCEIEVENKFPEELEYNVKVVGTDLYGGSKLVVPGHSKGIFILTYLPLSVGSFEGSVSFTNVKAGEIYCRVKMTSHGQKPQKVPLFKAELGKSSTHEILLHNPAPFNATVKAILTNPENFEVLPPVFEIPSQAFYKAVVKYNPNELDRQHSGDLVFRSEEIGEWKYLVFGKGDIPTDFEEKVVSATLGKEGNVVVTFLNPFKTSIILEISLEMDKLRKHDIFELINKKNKVSIQRGHSVSVPISFYPTEIREYRAKLVFKLSDKIQWIYPIKVVTEAVMTDTELNISTVCRKKKEKRFVLKLPGVKELREDDQFEIEITQLKSMDLGVMAEWLYLQPSSANVEVADRALGFSLRFQPHKPFRETGILTLTRHSGGKWR